MLSKRMCPPGEEGEKTTGSLAHQRKENSPDTEKDNDHQAHPKQAG